jgi:hypothetical protein
MGSRLLLVALSVIWASAARAVIVYGGDGTQNTTAPGNGAPWDHVGTVNGLTGVYLGSYDGSGWVITANHVGIGNFTVGGTTYTAVGGSGVQIGSADLFVFRLSTAPLLSNLALSSTAPGIGSNVTMIGNGANRATSLTTWFVDTDTNPYTWSTSPTAGSDSTASGYEWSAGQTMRWGTNVIDGSTTLNSTSLLYTGFSAVTGEAQGAVGDSGGAVFYQNGGTWELAGIMAYIETFSGQPGSTAVVGNRTDFVNLADYRGAVLTAVPEPADIALVMGALVAAAACWRRRRRA